MDRLSNQIRSAVALAAAYGRALQAELRRRSMGEFQLVFRLDRAHLQVVPLDWWPRQAPSPLAVLSLIQRAMPPERVAGSPHMIIGSANEAAESPDASAIDIPTGFDAWTATSDGMGLVLVLSPDSANSCKSESYDSILKWAWRATTAMHIQIVQRGSVQMPLAPHW